MLWRRSTLHSVYIFVNSSNIFAPQLISGPLADHGELDEEFYKDHPSRVAIAKLLDTRSVPARCCQLSKTVYLMSTDIFRA